MIGDGAILFDYAQAEGMTHFGTSAKFIDGRQGRPAPAGDPRSVGAAGDVLHRQPLVPEGFEYVIREIKADLRLSSISGGTDIVSCFVLGNPTLPVWRGEIQCRASAWRWMCSTTTGRRCAARRASWCARPFPVMPVGWNDPDGAKVSRRVPRASTTSGATATGSRSPCTTASSSTAARTPPQPGGVRIGTGRDLPPGRAAGGG